MRGADRIVLKHIRLMNNCFAQRAIICLAILVAAQSLHAQEERSQPTTPDTLPAVLQPSSHIFLMPTAIPIGSGHGYVSDYELFFPYAGVGIYDIFSATGGMTFVPGAPISSQVYTAMLKATLANSDGFAFALAANILDISTSNTYLHLYSVVTAEWDSTWISGALFYKATGPDIAVENAGSLFGKFTFIYTGNLGAALGFETPIASRSDMRLLGEAWSNDLTNSNDFVVMFGVRVRNEILSADFGLAYVHVPIPVPVMNFVYSW